MWKHDRAFVLDVWFGYTGGMNITDYAGGRGCGDDRKIALLFYIVGILLYGVI